MQPTQPQAQPNLTTKPLPSFDSDRAAIRTAFYSKAAKTTGDFPANSPTTGEYFFTAEQASFGKQLPTAELFQSAE